MESLHDTQVAGTLRHNLWKFPTISIDEAKSLQSGISSLYDDTVNGYLIKNFLTAEEVNFGLEHINILDPKANGAFSKNAGYSNPRSFSMLANESGVDNTLLSQYFDDVEQYQRNLKNLFPFGFEERLFALVSQMENNIAVMKPFIEWQNQHRCFTGSTIRVSFSERGGMNTHVGNMFRSIYPKFYSFLDTLMSIDGQISYFVMLSKPEHGGQLVLFDALWRDYVLFEDMDNKDKIVKKNGEKASLEQLDFQLVDPEPGDMILFNGGDIWHRINNPSGNRDRITIGGFFAKTTDNKKIYGWA